MVTPTTPTKAVINQDSALVKLPPELRNSIYHLVLTADKGERIEISFRSIKPRTAILRVCSQIRNEATQIFYAANEFHISDLLAQQSETDRFMKNAGDNITLIPKLAVRIHMPKIYTELLDLYHAVDINDDTADKMLEASDHIMETIHDSITQYAERLLDTGLKWYRIIVESCGYDPATLPVTKDQALGYTTLVSEALFMSIIFFDLMKELQAAACNDHESDEDGREESGVELGSDSESENEGDGIEDSEDQDNESESEVREENESEDEDE